MYANRHGSVAWGLQINAHSGRSVAVSKASIARRKVHRPSTSILELWTVWCSAHYLPNSSIVRVHRCAKSTARSVGSSRSGAWSLAGKPTFRNPRQSLDCRVSSVTPPLGPLDTSPVARIPRGSRLPRHKCRPVQTPSSTLDQQSIQAHASPAIVGSTSDHGLWTGFTMQSHHNETIRCFHSWRA